VTIANFFFHEVMGAPAMGRLRLLIEYYMRVDRESGLDRGAAARAAALAQVKGTLAQVRHFFCAFGKAAAAADTRSTTQLSGLYKMVDSLELLRFYGTLSKEVRVSSGALRAWLTKQHYSTTNTGKLGGKNVGRPRRSVRLADSLQASASSKTLHLPPKPPALIT
jgi:hypothetical protein